VDRLTPDAPEVARIDKALAEWRQGDVVRGPVDFIHMGDPSCPLTNLAGEAQGDGPTVLVGEEIGLVVLTQTCDLVRTCLERPFVEVAPLVEVDENELRPIERGYLMKYAHIPVLHGERLVAALDRVMTVEKTIVAQWARVLGCRNDAALQNRLKEKHDRQSDEGRALRALREIRVTAEPSWEAGQVTLVFWFVRHPEQRDFDGKAWDAWLDTWLKLVKKTDRYVAVRGLVTTLADMTAEDYVTSDPLDLDYLSLRGQRIG